MHFTDSEVGLYVRLLCVQWSSGSIPDDDIEIATYGKGKTNLSRVKAKFKKCDDGLLRNERMEIERKKQEDYRASRSENGRLGGRPRKAYENHMVSQTKAQESSPSPTPSPVSIAKGNSLTSEQISAQQELRRIEAAVRRINDSYSDHQAKSPEDIAEKKRLLARKKEIMPLTGWVT